MRLLCVLIFMISLFNNTTKKESYYSNSFIVMEQRTNSILEGVNYHKTQSVASISKIMTGIIALEELELKEKVWIDDCIDSVYGSAVYLKKGTWISNEDLIYGLLLRSGNDCALMLAKSVSNNLEKFVSLMNNKAKEIGMSNTIFVNPHGLDEIDGGNVSSCYDMALLQSYALKNSLYRKITSAKSYKSENYGEWINKNKLLKQYSYAISGKTGYTKIAKRTLVTSAHKDNLELIVVTLNCGNDFEYHKELYEKHFNLYGVKVIANKGNIRVLDYIGELEENIYYFTKKENLAKIKVFIEIDKENKVCYLYVLDGESKILLTSFKCKKIEKSVSFWLYFIDAFKSMIIG